MRISIFQKFLVRSYNNTVICRPSQFIIVYKLFNYVEGMGNKFKSINIKYTPENIVDFKFIRCVSKIYSMTRNTLKMLQTRL